MAKQKRPIKQRTDVKKDGIVGVPEHHGKHRETVESLPGHGGTKGGLNRRAGGGNFGKQQNTSLPKGHSGKPRGSRGS
jgi:hypothetical protein